MILLRYYLWIAPDLICGAAAVIAFRRNLHKHYPAFVSLLVFAFIFELWIVWAAALVWRSPHLHKWLTVFDIAAVFVLQMLVLHELLSNCRICRSSFARLFRPLPRWTAAITILLAVVATALLPQTAQEGVVRLFLNLDLGLNIITAGLLFAILFAARILHLSLPRVAMGIALGIGITAAVEIGISPLMSVLGRSRYIALDVIRMAAFHISAVVWLICLLLPEKRGAITQSCRLTPDIQLHVEGLHRMVE